MSALDADIPLAQNRNSFVFAVARTARITRPA
jgi:hypothetical protein